MNAVHIARYIAADSALEKTSNINTYYSLKSLKLSDRYENIHSTIFFKILPLINKNRSLNAENFPHSKSLCHIHSSYFVRNGGDVSNIDYRGPRFLEKFTLLNTFDYFP